MPLTTKDLIFPEQSSHNFGKTLVELRRSNLTIRNRLVSIHHDSHFAEQIFAKYGRPLIANERCGSWYVQPKIKVASAYFKSTDGHTGVWKFSVRRLNLHLLEIIGKNDGCIIVDSTRRGKSMPDALIKTVPIWCAVLNRYIFPEKSTWHSLHCPPQLVSPSEFDQINSLLPYFVTNLQSLNISPIQLRKYLYKPLRPLWVTPDSVFSDEKLNFPDFHPVICCTVSRHIEGGELSASGYIQGAGDDTENWAHGLTPELFWEKIEELLLISNSDLPDYIEKLVLVQKSSSKCIKKEMRCIRPTSCLFITSISELDDTTTCPNSCLILLLPDSKENVILNNKIMIGIGREKLAARNLRKTLPLITNFVASKVKNKNIKLKNNENNFKIIVACETGKESSIGVALVILCLFFDDDANLMEIHRDKRAINKSFIKSRLSWISVSIPEVNPRRATLQSVNNFLMST
ncbi:tRNA A64-2'-O-ribosylphosphate transferase [Erysiphe necator]|nr:tRNA A64-2'-O-ribosylphosphate transferase [Erysiphe necator]